MTKKTAAPTEFVVHRRAKNTDRLQLAFPPELKKALKDRAEKEGVSVNNFVIQLVAHTLGIKY